MKDSSWSQFNIFMKIVPIFIVILVVSLLIVDYFKNESLKMYQTGSKIYDLKEKKYKIVQYYKSYEAGNVFDISLINKQTGEPVNLNPIVPPEIAGGGRGGPRHYILYNFDNKISGEYELIVKSSDNIKEIPDSGWVAIFEMK